MTANRLSDNLWVQITIHVPPKYAKLTEDVALAMGEAVAPAIRTIFDEYLKKPTEPDFVLGRAPRGKSEEGRKPVKAYLSPDVAKRLNELCEQWGCHRNQIFIEALERKAHKLKKKGLL